MLFESESDIDKVGDAMDMLTSFDGEGDAVRFTVTDSTVSDSVVPRTRVSLNAFRWPLTVDDFADEGDDVIFEMVSTKVAVNGEKE